MSDEFEDLLAFPARRSRAATPADAASKLDLERRMNLAATGKQEVNSVEFMRPVTQAFLAEVFSIDPRKVKRQLAHCPNLGERKGKTLYDFKTACAYLLKPKMDVETFVRTLNPADMPPLVNKAFWEAIRVKNKVLLETGEAWATADVLDVLGEVFMLVKDRIPLITEEMRDRGLTDAQAAKLRELCDQFQSDLHEALVEMPRRRSTQSRRAEVEGMVGELSATDEAGDNAD